MPGCPQLAYVDCCKVNVEEKSTQLEAMIETKRSENRVRELLQELADLRGDVLPALMDEEQPHQVCHHVIVHIDIGYCTFQYTGLYHR